MPDAVWVGGYESGIRGGEALRDLRINCDATERGTTREFS